MRWSAVALAALAVASCIRTEGVNLDEVEVSLLSARAIGCDAVCSSILVEIVVKNDNQEPVCFSSRYLTSVLGSVVISELGQKDTDGFLTNFPPVEEFPDNPDRPGPFVGVLRAEPNIYVAPRQKVRFEAAAFDSFRIPRDRALRATLGMYVYPCEGKGFRRFSPSVPLQAGVPNHLDKNSV
ncbi:hypothetical protein ACIQTU_05955 [Brevundimonas sp. NPDC090276]|uniref:hypothetical protein n=1 Tax=Brevundimonas sp. NPDC090276 TaxID=3363956 RepID=UPI00383AA397